jgi:hypothetical protein
MKILLDDCVTKRLKQHLIEYEIFTVTQMHWNGLKNGKLLTECVSNNFAIVLTIDKKPDVSAEFGQASAKHCCS